MKKFLRLPRRAEILLDCLLLFLFTVILLKPYFTVEYTDKWASIESTFIADARFLLEHWPHPQWQPLWYTGTRFDFVYPPALRYGTAIIAKVAGWPPVKAYHFYTTFFYCVGIVGVYVFIRAAMRSRGAAVIGALATALMSPTFLFMKQFRVDSDHLMPLRLGVLIRYGEGPHITALALLPFALAFTWLAVDTRRPVWVALAAIFSAAVVSNNFYGATALAMFYVILAWSFWITRLDKGIVLPLLAIPPLAYGLTAFWLVKSYVEVTVNNMQFVAARGTTWSIWVGLAVTVAFLVTSDRLARGKRERTWAVFAWGSVAFFSLNVVGNYFWNFRISGEPLRHVPELDLVYIFGIAGLLGWIWRRTGWAPRAAVALMVLTAFYWTTGYVKRAWLASPPWPEYQKRVEYRITEWLAKNMPDSRHYVTGSVRFWYNTWFDLAQLGGGAEQGLLNPLVEPAQWEINLGSDASTSLLWLQAMGVDTIYVSDKRSEEVYKDLQYPEKFNGVFPVLFDDQQGNFIYRVPRRFPTRARVVETGRLDALQPVRGEGSPPEQLRPYVEVIEKGPDSLATFRRDGTDAMYVNATVGPGQSIVVQETYDPAWQAWSGNARLPVRKDALGFIVIDPPPGTHEIHIVFVMPRQNKFGWALTAVTVLILAGLVLRGRRSA